MRALQKQERKIELELEEIRENIEAIANRINDQRENEENLNA